MGWEAPVIAALPGARSPHFAVGDGAPVAEVPQRERRGGMLPEGVRCGPFLRLLASRWEQAAARA